MNFLLSDKKTIKFLFIIYLIANFPIFLNYNGIYWDDWVLYSHSFETMNTMFIQAIGFAAYPTSIIHYSLLNIGNGILSYRILTVVLLFLSAIYIYKILKNINNISNQDRFFIVLFVLFAPLFSAKIAIVNFLYVFFLTAFFMAFYFLSRNIYKLNIIKRILILSIFFFSFLINSLLVFYAIVLLYFFYVLYCYEKTFFRNICIFIKTKIDFIILPIAFYMVKSTYFVPSGIYSNYNRIQLVQILNFEEYYKTFKLSFIEPILVSLVIFKPFIVIVIVLFSLSFLFLRQSYSIQKRNLYLLLVGFLFFFLGAFAYISVGKIPNLNDWYSRFQLLLPLGFSFILYYGIEITFNLLKFKELVKLFVYCILIISFITFHIKEQIKYNIDWMYQQSIMENFRISEVIQKNNTFICNIQLNDKLANNRAFRVYELTGMSRKVFQKDDKLFVLKKSQIEEYKKYKNNSEFNYTSWEQSTPIYFDVEDRIDNGFNDFKKSSLIYLLRLKYLELFEREEFKKEISTLVSFNFKKEE